MLSYQGSFNPESIISHLIDMGEGYRVSSSSAEVDQVLRFVRAHYGFGDMDEFPLINNGEDYLPSFLPDFDVKLAVMQYYDSSVLDAALRALSTYVEGRLAGECAEGRAVDDNSEDGNNDCPLASSSTIEISSIHLTALKQTADIVSRRKQGHIPQEVQGHVEHRPTWNSVKILRIIEKTIKASIEMSSRSHLSSYASISPANFFDPWVFHQILHNLDADSEPAHTALPRTHSLASLDSDIEHRVMKDSSGSTALPIDEHEATILETIKSQRVTIVEGETGCGKVRLTMKYCPFPLSGPIIML